ncbi:hypothetical protein LSTR_LSTR007192 [Laodelphax striatellus]|uniref:Male-enhanced antigen 1 n=1 Tax=Laodelphax striatellus TaxID=195883 RepID=A0A482WXQ8_LAOST|nr:hypothetical protein LSTR_LSTR007192 [Laodelphax striatellus]
MVKSWAPEPPEDRDDHLPVLSSEHLIFPQSEDSDDMHDHTDPPTGYTLFANTNVEDHSNADSDDSDDSTSIGHSSETIPQSGAESHSQTLPTSSTDSAEVCKLFNTPRPADLVIDCDQVRAAMASVTLPPSAFPPWAVGVSDSELTNQIQRLLSNTRPTDSSNSCSSTVLKDSE